MLYPTIDELTQGKYNRYELALATARCARLITDEYVRQHDLAEKSITGNKDTDRPLNTMIDRELRDEKAVQVAIGRMYRGEYAIDLEANAKQAEDAEITEDAEVAEEAVEAVAEDLAEEGTAEAAEEAMAEVAEEAAPEAADAE
ncbi:MAG: hypothetical protein IKA05_00825 [Clostridia bacterium]|nr:hypothetical protein [Clostridia bacterium]